MDVANIRLQSYAKATGTTVPKKLLAADAAPSLALMDYCEETGCSLDWVFRCDPRPLVDCGQIGA